MYKKTSAVPFGKPRIVVEPSAGNRIALGAVVWTLGKIVQLTLGELDIERAVPLGVGIVFLAQGTHH